MSLIDHVDKRTINGEIIVTLFEQCNLTCKFCPQDHNSVIGMKEIKEKKDYIIQSILHLQEQGRNQYSVHLMGGEVFSDLISTEIFEDYYQLVKSLFEWSSTNNINLEIAFTTNMVFSNYKRVNQLITRLFALDPNVYLMTSYDPHSRFNSNSLKLFTSNVRKLKKWIRTVNVIMTKPAIIKFLNDDIPFFDYLYRNFDIYFDYYTPENNSKQFMPTDIELKTLMLYLVDNYPSCLPVKDYFSKKKIRMSCQDTYTILPNNLAGMCTILLDGYYKGYKRNKEDMETRFMEDYNCLECEHFNRCSLGCFLSHDLSETRTQEECWLKEVYNYVDSKHGINYQTH